jgi:Xaa-Pro aminopeptidase
VAASDDDQAARALLESRGYGAAFVHATGHGLGLEVHEAPRIGKPGDEAPEVLAAGMVFTVEPGAYVEGVAGVRLEDDVMVVEGGVESLTDAPRELLIA